MDEKRPEIAAETPPPLQSPLHFAVATRDAKAVDMVREALRRRRALLAFQPVVQARDPDKPAFWEGLIRIQDPSGRTIPAKDFMTVVETNEVGRMIDCLSLEMGLEVLAQEPSLRLSINMSARSIGYARWLQTLDRGLARDHSVAERLILEITESSAMLMPDLVRAFMEEQQLRGIAFALDDFGAGYTAFRYLRDFDFDILKIDGEFIRGVAGNPDNQALTRALVSVARHFDMFTVAENVETIEDAHWLVESGLDCLQGYYFAAPTVNPWWEDGKGAKSA